MYFRVYCQIAAISEAFAADNAVKWFFALNGLKED
jgi:hypothetical protein